MSATWKNRETEKHREAMRQRAARKRELLHIKLTELKSARGCDACGFSDSACLTYVHRSDEQMDFKVNLRAWSFSHEMIDNEIAKCDLLCANCLILHQTGR
jgi:hypothetical protein